ncbi:TetR/AcrR family transcriptional regulator [Gracilibacillus salinarum]|uniref:TetR/AcrR family transcriptional regulator n=1 Tax=Gracilibacillus salinarum TaxID=2932255 RepID=A0ABY4GL19_9BACI|nr:TetR/AcrR family transcriptional regulator [Gracilibacillus salinarum]UOQ84899.1 TetR/AcrR family transcriptional regulator [Gracilibacillus salinarum]
MISNDNYRKERRDAAENRHRILEVAYRLFSQHNIEKVSMNQIAKEAGIGAGTLYRRYNNKGEVCLDLIKDNFCGFLEEVHLYLASHQHELASYRFKGVLPLFIRFKESKASLLKGVEKSSTSNRHIITSPLYNELHQVMVGLFDEMNQSEFRVDNSTFRADMVLLAFSSDSYLFQREVRGLSSDEFLDHIHTTFLYK